MPEWEIHQKWAQKMGLTLEAARYVDKLIDMSKKVPEYRDLYTRLFAEGAEESEFFKEFFKEIPDDKINEWKGLSWIVRWKIDSITQRTIPPGRVKILEHDGGRGKKGYLDDLEAFVQQKFLCLNKGCESLKAWYLHHILDYMSSCGYFEQEEFFQRIEERLEVILNEDLYDEVKNFVSIHWKEILSDLGF